MKQLFIIVVLFHDKINEVKALWGTVDHLEVEIKVMSKKQETMRGHNKQFRYYQSGREREFSAKASANRTVPPRRIS